MEASKVVDVIMGGHNKAQIGETSEPGHEKTCLREFPTRPDSNWPVQLQKLARILKLWI